MKRRVTLSILSLATVVCLPLMAQTDPGVRGGSAGAGAPLASVAADPTLLAFFETGLEDFEEVEDVPDGLGPRFNALSCGECHSQPAIGGTSPSVNPQIAAATAEGANNNIPSFISVNGPVREARFIYFFNSNGTPNTNDPNGSGTLLVSDRGDAATHGMLGVTGRRVHTDFGGTQPHPGTSKG